VRKVWRQLGREGIAVARCTVARLMRQMDTSKNSLPMPEGR
jgi:transposase InsO family protein